MITSDHIDPAVRKCLLCAGVMDLLQCQKCGCTFHARCMHWPKDADPSQVPCPSCMVEAGMAGNGGEDVAQQQHANGAAAATNSMPAGAVSPGVASGNKPGGEAAAFGMGAQLPVPQPSTSLGGAPSSLTPSFETAAALGMSAPTHNKLVKTEGGAVGATAANKSVADRTAAVSKSRRIFSGEAGGLREGVRVQYRQSAEGEVLLEGSVVLTNTETGAAGGIRCDCCKMVISCSQFETHAGKGNRRSPYEFIFTVDNNMSLRTMSEQMAC